MKDIYDYIAMEAIESEYPPLDEFEFLLDLMGEGHRRKIEDSLKADPGLN